MLMSPDHTLYEVGNGRQRQTTLWSAKLPARAQTHNVCYVWCVYMYVCQWFVGLSWQATADHRAGAAFPAVVPDP